MNAGLPGTGIGGLFYLACALFMPVHRVLFGGGRDGRSWRRVITQSVIACGILAMVWLTIRGLDHLATLFPESPRIAGAQRSGSAAAGEPMLLRWFALLGAAGALVLVIGVVELSRLVVKRPGWRRERE